VGQVYQVKNWSTIRELVNDTNSIVEATEKGFNSLAERSGYKVLKGGKYRANNGFDHVWQAKDGSIVIVDSKQLKNGALQVSTKGAKYGDDFTNQLSEDWITAVEKQLPRDGEVRRAFELARESDSPIKTIIVAVDKSDKTVKIIPVKIPNKSRSK